ncbi:ankyrin repeat-containing protein ITN1 isoform X2 [Cajanus cajan]|nr:ankyrin repeat-containing protein ITN1 isoform X2 [Cajanus cajan]XP_029125666.1 ankyrin repeat-containing protein ITN1 isoform X2 [Cajanus cajan]
MRWNLRRRRKRKSEARGFQRSNWVEDDPEDELEIIIASNRSQELTPISTSAASSPRNGSSTSRSGFNAMTPEALECLKKELYLYASKDMWAEAEPTFNHYPDMVCTPLTASGDTTLHVAVSAKSNSFVEGLMKHMTREKLRIPDSEGNTVFCTAAISGNADLFTIMKQNQDLFVIPRLDGMLPVHLAALTGNHQIVQDLSSQDLLSKMTPHDIQQLFFITIRSRMFDVAMTLFKAYPSDLAAAKDDQENQENQEKQTALHMLARKPPEELTYMKEDDNKGKGMQLLEMIWNQVRQLKHKKILELITRPSIVLFDAVESGNVEVVKWLLYMNRELLTIKNIDGRNVLHFAVLCRQRSIFSYILKMGTVKLILQAPDNTGNNILHLAAHPRQNEASLDFRANIQMRRELAWFKEVEKSVPLELRRMKNKKGKTPYDVFYDKHKLLSEEIKGAAKEIANSSMLVATLVATVAFAAALTVPGDKTNVWFIVFILTNAVALFTSSASILSFLSNFTSSRFAESQFFISLHPSLLLGVMLLLISVTAMVIAFVAASFLIFAHTSKWVAYAVVPMGFFPILLFLLFQFRLFDDFLWSRYYLLALVSKS